MEAKLTRVNGVLKVDIDGEIYEPLSFKSFRPTARNISDFYNAGVRLFSILTSGLYSILGVSYSLYGESWLDYETYDFSAVDAQVELFLKNAPEGYFALMFQLDTRPWYIEKENCPNSFTHLSQVAASEKWRALAAKYLQAMIRHTEEKYGDRFYGYFLLGGTTTEWFSDRDFMAPHPIKEEAYRQYLGDPNARIPDLERREQDPGKAILDPVRDSDVVSYTRFHNELISDTILYFAAKAQEVLQHKKLLGIYYGYLLELERARLWNAGSLGFEKVYQSPDIDMISSPSSYHFRSHASCSSYMVTYNTLDRHNKLYYLEFDHITHLAPQFIEGFGIPGWQAKFADEQQTVDVMRRDFMLCLSKGAALWWFDMFEGWFYSDGMMAEVRKMMDIALKSREKQFESAAEIAVFAEGESLYYANKMSGINESLLSAQREGLARMGAPYDIYAMGDLGQTDLSRYKLAIFLDALKISDENKQYLKQLQHILWVYAPDYAGENDLSLNRMEEITGMKLSMLETPEAEVQAFGTVFGNVQPWTPCFAVTDPDAEVLGTYLQSGAVGLAQKGNCVYSAVGNLSAEVLREIARRAGVHIYSQTRDVVYVNRNMIGLYSDTDGEVNVDCGDIRKLEEQFEGGIYETENGKLTLIMRKGEAKLFFVTEEERK